MGLGEMGGHRRYVVHRHYYHCRATYTDTFGWNDAPRSVSDARVSDAWKQKLQQLQLLLGSSDGLSCTTPHWIVLVSQQSSARHLKTTHSRLFIYQHCHMPTSGCYATVYVELGKIYLTKFQLSNKNSACTCSNIAKNKCVKNKKKCSIVRSR